MREIMVLVLGLIFLSEEIFAEEKKKELPTFKSDEIVVTASRSKSPLKDLSSNVTIIKKEEIERVGHGSVDELLFKVAPDINTQESRFSQTRTRQVTLRGVPDQGKTLVLVDGIPVNSPWHGWLDWNLVPTENIERIEIIRGPVSSLYGSGAMGGVINIVTKTPVQPRETKLSCYYGKMNTGVFNIVQGGNSKSFSYTVVGHLLGSDGYIAEKAPQPYNIKRERKQRNINSKFVFRPGINSSFTLGLAHNDDRFGRGRRYSNMDMKTTLGYLTYNKETENTSWRVNLYSDYQRWLVDFDRPPDYNCLFSTEDFSMTDRGASLELNILLEKRNKLTLGLESKYCKVDQKSDYKTLVRESQTKGNQIYFAPFIQDELKLFEEKLILTLGGRLDWYKNYNGSFYDTNPPRSQSIEQFYVDTKWNEFCPKFGLLYHLGKKTSIRTSIGKGFQAPSLPRLYTIMTRGVRTIKGNPELKPESLWSFEGGIDREITPGLLTKLTLYKSRGYDFIVARNVAPHTLQFDNVSKVEMFGLEAESTCEITEEWSSSLGYSYNRSRAKEDKANPMVEGNDLAFTPRNKLILGINYDNPRLFTVISRLKYTGRMYSDLENTDSLSDYWTFDIGVSKRISKISELRLDCENLLDKHYDIPDMSENLVAPGRIITGSVNIKF